MKLTFKLVSATDLTNFDTLVNNYLDRGYRFIQGQPMSITPHEDIGGQGYQYSVAMLLEENDNVQNT